MIARAECRALIRLLARAALVPAGAWRCISCDSCWRSAGTPASSSRGRDIRICIRWCRGSCCCSASRPGRSCGGSVARWGVSDRLRATRSRWPRCGLCAPPAWLRSMSRRSFSRVCFATGHPAGLAGIFGYGGWWSIPAALCVGLVLAAVFHGARWVLDEVAQRRDRVVRAAVPRPATPPRPRDALLASALAAGRGLVGPRSSRLSRRAPFLDRSACADSRSASGHWSERRARRCRQRPRSGRRRGSRRRQQLGRDPRSPRHRRSVRHAARRARCGRRWLQASAEHPRVTPRRLVGAPRIQGGPLK